MPTNQTLPCREAFEKWDAQDNGVVSRWKVWEAACEWMNTRAQSSAPEGGEAVAEVVSAHGDPEAFGEREIRVLTDLRKLQYGTKLYTRSNAQGGQVTDDMAVAASNMFSRLKKRGHSQFDAIKKAVDAALSTSRSNDKGTEGG